MRTTIHTEHAPYIVYQVHADFTDELICELVTHPTLTVVQTWQPADDFFMWVVNIARDNTSGIIDSHIRVPISEMIIDQP